MSRKRISQHEVMKWQLGFNKDLKAEEYIEQMMAKNLSYLD